MHTCFAICLTVFLGVFFFVLFSLFPVFTFGTGSETPEQNNKTVDLLLFTFFRGRHHSDYLKCL